LLDTTPEVETAAIEPREIPGREGWVACQADRNFEMDTT
jgi:hypothetical protein